MFHMTGSLYSAVPRNSKSRSEVNAADSIIFLQSHFTLLGLTERWSEHSPKTDSLRSQLRRMRAQLKRCAFMKEEKIRKRGRSAYGCRI